MKNYDSELKILDFYVVELRFQKNPNDPEITKEYEINSDYADKMIEIKAILELSDNLDSRSPVVNNGHNSDNLQTYLKRPTAPLPNFNSAEGENLEAFFQNFETTVNRYNYSGYDKFLLLKQQIKGRALILLNSLEIDSQTYDKAKDLLMKALASPVTQKFNVVKQLTELKMTTDMDPFEYMSKISTNMDLVKKLNISAEDFLQYFILNGMNDSFRNQLVNITNHTRPSLSEIQDKFFDASERYLNLKKFKEPKINIVKSKEAEHCTSTTNYAVGVNYTSKKEDQSNPKLCSLCQFDEIKEVNHTLHYCTKYPDAKSKVRKLENLKGCIKCGYLSHGTHECKFKFRSKCFNCSQWHFTFLCSPKEPT